MVVYRSCFYIKVSAYTALDLGRKRNEASEN
jgi:hypothetical protein